VARPWEISYFSRGRRPHFTQDGNCLPVRARLTIFCHASLFIDHGKDDATVSGCARDTRDMCAQHFCRGFSFYRPTLMGIPTLPPAGRKKGVFRRFNRHLKLDFRCRREKKLYSISSVWKFGFSHVTTVIAHWVVTFRAKRFHEQLFIGVWHSSSNISSVLSPNIRPTPRTTI